jgi:predicted kinase
MNSPSVYIFRGAPASGKGTLVPRFCEILPKPIALIEQDQFRWGLHLIGRSIPEVTDEEHRLAHRNAVLIYEQYLKSGSYTIVFEGLLTYDNPESSQGSVRELADLAERYGFAFQSVVLTAEKSELFKRNAQRQYSVPAEEFEQLYSDVYDTIGADELVIDTTGLGEQESIDKLIRGIESSNRSA